MNDMALQQQHSYSGLAIELEGVELYSSKGNHLNLEFNIVYSNTFKKYTT